MVKAVLWAAKPTSTLLWMVKAVLWAAGVCQDLDLTIEELAQILARYLT
jgi:hypothetical protein